MATMRTGRARSSSAAVAFDTATSRTWTVITLPRPAASRAGLGRTTAELLLHQFTLQQGSTMFPLKTPAALPEGARQALTDLRATATLPAGQREARLLELDARLQELRDSVVDGHWLRLDGTILHTRIGRAGVVRRFGRSHHTSRAWSNLRSSDVRRATSAPVDSQRF
jgi:hypothetical protein